MNSRLKFIAAAVGAFLGLAMLVPASAPVAAQDLKSLRGDMPLTEESAAPTLLGYKEGGNHPRAFRQQPPLIPHRIEKYEVDLKVNQCLYCHEWQNSKKMGATQISETHYIDRDGRRLDVVAGTRWFCTQCHVPQTDAEPLVENQFAPASQIR